MRIADRVLSDQKGNMMTDEQFASIWDAIEDTPSEAARMKLRSALMIALKDLIDRRGWTRTEAARHFGVTQARISDLCRGKINHFSLDLLVDMVGAARLHVEVRVAEAA
jgi:predicted XRE-type DNA-binding protein